MNKLTCMNSGTNEKSWKYKSDLSFSDSRLVFENEYGPVSLSMIVKGVKIVFFSLTLALLYQRLFRLQNSDLQMLALIKVHFGLGQLERRQHVQYLADVRVGALDELIDNVGRDFHLLPEKSACYLCASRILMYLKRIDMIRDRISFG
jgi:hypothetical protein